MICFPGAFCPDIPRVGNDLTVIERRQPACFYLHRHKEVSSYSEIFISIYECGAGFLRVGLG